MYIFQLLFVSKKFIYEILCVICKKTYTQIFEFRNILVYNIYCVEGTNKLVLENI